MTEPNEFDQVDKDNKLLLNELSEELKRGQSIMVEKVHLQIAGKIRSHIPNAKFSVWRCNECSKLTAIVWKSCACHKNQQSNGSERDRSECV